MTVATIKLVNEQFMQEFYLRRDSQEQTARSLQKDGWYRQAGTLTIPGLRGHEQEVAEEIFDLTNNPGRQAEREELYGRGRSVSVGDIITVDGVDLLCCSQGWQRL